MINKRKIPENILNSAKNKLEELEKLNNSYMKVLNYQRWVITEDVIADVKVTSDFLQQLNKIYIGNLKSVTSDLIEQLSQFGRFTYKFIKQKECMFVDYDNPNAPFICLRELKNFKIGRTPAFCKEIPEMYQNPDPTILYVCNLHQDVTEEILENILPGVEYIKMSYNKTFKHDGYCYIKFTNANITKQVAKYFSELTLYNKKVYTTPLVINMEIPKFLLPDLPNEVYAIKKRIDGRLFKRGKLLELKNILDVEEFDDDFEKEIRKELEQFGEIDDLKFILNKDVVVLCKFKEQTQCRQAFDQLNGRYFGGKRINATVLEE